MSNSLLVESDSPLHSDIHVNNDYNDSKNTYANPFEVSSNFSSDPTHVTIEPDDVDLSSPFARVSANNAKFSGSNSNNDYNVNVINDNSSSRPINVTGSIGSQPLRFASDTLDEPVSETIIRDVKNVAIKLQQVLKPKGGRKDILKDWDLWGPLFLCLTLSIILCVKAPKEQEITVFTGVFVIVWCGAAAVTINAKLLGGNVSFFQSVCILGYCIFPLVLVAVIFTAFNSVLNYWIRVPLMIIAFAWSSYASVNFLSTSHLTNRRMLAVYPLFLFYFIIGWIILMSYYNN